MQKSLSLLETRHKLGFTQAQLAEILGITAEYISMIENGRKNPSRKILNKLDELIIQFNKRDDSFGIRLSKQYYPQDERPRVDGVHENESTSYLLKEIEILRNELRDARSVIRDQAMALASMSVNHERKKQPEDPS